MTVVEGLPAGLEVSIDGLAAELARRRLGFGRGPRMRLEKDTVEVLAGIRFGLTLGSPVAVIVRNTEWERWKDEMSIEAGTTDRPMTAPRPGHADLAGMLKYDTHDARDILERASARETAARTVAGFLAKSLLRTVDVAVVSHVVAIGGVAVPAGITPGPTDHEVVDASPVRAVDAATGEVMVAAIERAKAKRDTLGGVVEVLAYGVPPGVGSHVHYDRRLDGKLAGALMSIQGIKGVEIGDGFIVSAGPGSAAHDEIYHAGGQFRRHTDRAGGIEGGMSIGSPVRVRAAMKPISTLMRPLGTVDVVTKERAKAFRERSDVCAVPAAAVVAEEMVAIVIAQEMQRKFGGDTVADFRASVEAYRARLEAF